MTDGKAPRMRVVRDENGVVWTRLGADPEPLRPPIVMTASGSDLRWLQHSAAEGLSAAVICMVRDQLHVLAMMRDDPPAIAMLAWIRQALENETLGGEAVATGHTVGYAVIAPADLLRSLMTDWTADERRSH